LTFSLDYTNYRVGTLRLQLEGMPSTLYNVDLYQGVEGSLRGEPQLTDPSIPQTTLGVTTNASGVVDMTFVVTVDAGSTILTATATDLNGNTSEFSPLVRVPDLVADSKACGVCGAEVLPLLGCAWLVRRRNRRRKRTTAP